MEKSMTIEINIYMHYWFFNYTSSILPFFYISAGLASSFSDKDVSMMGQW